MRYLFAIFRLGQLLGEQSQAPLGVPFWSLRLLAEKVVEWGVCDHISYVQVDKILKKTSKAASQQDLMYRKDRCPVHCPHGAPLMAPQLAIRHGLPSSML